MDVIGEIIHQKYKYSNKHYSKRFKGEPVHDFLYYYDVMNVYPLFPTPIDLPIKHYIDKFSIKDIIKNIDLSKKDSRSNDYKSKVENFINSNNEIIAEVNSKIKEVQFDIEEIKRRARPMVRKLFSYEIIDDIADNYGGEYITVAWLKCFEIINYYKLLDNISDSEDTYNYFGICEQPGAFVYAINHYIKTNTNKKYNFILESLVDPHNKKIFRAEPGLKEKYPDSYDYGYDGTGDVTNVDNIRFYREKYIKKKKMKFHIMTADCGLDCSDDFSTQEVMLVNVILGQFLLAISLSSKGSNYFFKLFTMYDNLTQELIFLASLLYEEVCIVRTLTTKPQSGEIYCVCKNFKYDPNNKDIDKLINSLLDWYELSKKYIFKENFITDKYFNRIRKQNILLSKRRIASINFLILRFKNSHYVKRNPPIYKYVKDLVIHYTKYYKDYYNVKKLENDKKLV